MKRQKVQLLTRWSNANKCLEYQKARLTDLNDSCGILTIIFSTRTIFGSVEFIDIFDILCIITIGMIGNRWDNSIVVSCRILIDEISELLLICMSCNTKFSNIPKLYSAIQFKYSVLYILAIIIVCNRNSIGFLVFAATTRIIMWKIIRVQMIQIDILNFTIKNVDVICSNHSNMIVWMHCFSLVGRMSVLNLYLHLLMSHTWIAFSSVMINENMWLNFLRLKKKSSTGCASNLIILVRKYMHCHSITISIQQKTSLKLY